MSNSTLVGLLPAPDGVTPDFNIHHLTETQISFLLAYGITLVLATITLSLRLYTRLCIVKSFGLDDAVVLLAMAFSVWYFYISVDSMKYGFGRHLWEVTAPQLQGYLSKSLTPMVATYAWAPAFTKLSILLLLWRLNPTLLFRIALGATAFIIITYTLTITLVIRFPCSPIKPDTGNCLNQCGLWQAVLNILTDVLILALPMHMLYHLNLPLRQKLILGSVFSTGLFVVAICIIRITYIMSLQDNPDVTYSQGEAAVWSSVEINIGIVCNTVVVLKPALRKFVPSFFGSSQNRSNTPTRPTPLLNQRGFYTPNRRKDKDSFQMMTHEGNDRSDTDGSDHDRTLGDVETGKGGVQRATESIDIEDMIKLSPRREVVRVV